MKQVSVNSEQQQQQLITVKAKHGEELRRFSIALNSTWEEVLSKLCSLFTLQADNIVVRYQDDENEMITLDSDGELQEAIRVFLHLANESGIPCIRVHISDAPKKASSSVISRSVPEQQQQYHSFQEEKHGRGYHKDRRSWRRGENNKEYCEISNEELKSKLLQLEERGFKCKMRNIRLLKMNNGDVEKVSEFLLANQKKRKDYEEKYQQLVQNGFTNKGLNWCLLRKFDGNLDKVIATLKQCKELEDKGYDKPGLNVRLLIKFDGDVAKVEEIWKKKREKLLNKREKKVEKKLKKAAWKQRKFEKKRDWKQGRKCDWKRKHYGVMWEEKKHD